LSGRFSEYLIWMIVITGQMCETSIQTSSGMIMRKRVFGSRPVRDDTFVFGSVCFAYAYKARFTWMDWVMCMVLKRLKSVGNVLVEMADDAEWRKWAALKFIFRKSI
jgi:hypothetical protein